MLPLEYFCPALSDNWYLKPSFRLFESGHFIQVLLTTQLLRFYFSSKTYVVGTQKTRLNAHPKQESFLKKQGNQKKKKI